MLREMDAPKVASPNPLFIGVIFCSSDVTVPGRETEKLADSEIFDTAQAVKTALESQGHLVELVDLGKMGVEVLRKFNWIFNLAENVFGFPYQEYEITEMIEHLGIGFTGANSACLKACLDKAWTKTELIRCGITTPAFDVYQSGDAIHSQLHFHLIVKPVHEDGSVGITPDSIVEKPADLPSRVKKIHEIYCQSALVEEFIDGRDITASVIGNGSEAVVLPLSECIYPEQDIPRLLSFEAVWQPDSKAYQSIIAKCPSDLDPEEEQRIKTAALSAYRIMGCRDYCRVDFRLKDKIPYALEVNPNPCISPDDAGFVRSGKASGLSYQELVNKILDISIKDKNRIAFSAPERK